MTINKLDSHTAHSKMVDGVNKVYYDSLLFIKPVCYRFVCELSTKNTNLYFCHHYLLKLSALL